MRDREAEGRRERWRNGTPDLSDSSQGASFLLQNIEAETRSNHTTLKLAVSDFECARSNHTTLKLAVSDLFLALCIM